MAAGVARIVVEKMERDVMVDIGGGGEWNEAGSS